MNIKFKLIVILFFFISENSLSAEENKNKQQDSLPVKTEINTMLNKTHKYLMMIKSDQDKLKKKMESLEQENFRLKKTCVTYQNKSSQNIDNKDSGNLTEKIKPHTISKKKENRLQRASYNNAIKKINRLPLSEDCELVGKWFIENTENTVESSFFTRDNNGNLHICKLVDSKWEDFVAKNRTTTYLIERR